MSSNDPETTAATLPLQELFELSRIPPEHVEDMIALARKHGGAGEWGRVERLCHELMRLKCKVAAYEDITRNERVRAHLGAQPSTTDHRWRISDGGRTHGHAVECVRCKLELVPCVDLKGAAPTSDLYVAGRVAEKYTPSKHGECPCPCPGELQ